jgi:hypothetical protein
MWLVKYRRQALLAHVLSHLASRGKVAADQVLASSSLSSRSIPNPRWQVMSTGRHNHTVAGRESRKGSEEVGRPTNVVTKCQQKAKKRGTSPDPQSIQRTSAPGAGRTSGELTTAYSLTCISLPSGPGRRKTGSGDSSAVQVVSLHASQKCAKCTSVKASSSFCNRL